MDNKTRSLYFSDSISSEMKSVFGYPLTIVEAPMGYGKTTAVREYLTHAQANILWLKLFDNSTDSFWKGLCHLFSPLDCDRSNHLEQLGFPNDSVSYQEAARWIAGILFPEKTVLVLDDYHLLEQAEVNRFIEFIVVNEIENLHIVLTARFIEFPGMDELALKGYLHHISQDAFELGPNEITKYYKLCGINLKVSDANKLFSMTEGWISALYLMMLHYQKTGSFDVSSSIYKLVENTVYNPFPEDIKTFLLSLCHFDSFSMNQAVFMWGNDHARNYLAQVTEKNAFVSYDVNTKTYQMHPIFTSFLKEAFEQKTEPFRRHVFEKAGHWYVQTGEYHTAMTFFYAGGDFDHLLMTVELDKGNSFGIKQKELIIKLFEECPANIKQQHPMTLLIYALALMTFNEMELFEKVCQEFIGLIQGIDLGPAHMNRLLGEFELLLSFTRYNDIKGMSEHIQKSWELLKQPSAFMDTKGNWTFGSPSVLYMFYRERGKLAEEVREIKSAMPGYYRLTHGHGMGAEHLMEAEWLLNQGDIENAEITAHKALTRAECAHQPSMVLCAQFIQARLALVKGDYNNLLHLFRKMHETIEHYKAYELIHTIDMCTGYIYAFLQHIHKIPEWLGKGDFTSSRLLFPTLAFSHIIYGRVLLMRGDYVMLLGLAEQFMGIASVFPNMLAHVYTKIYVAAASERIFRRGEAMEVMKQALDMAIPDKLYMPFVENCDYILSLLEALYHQGTYREDIARIMELAMPYQKVVRQIKGANLEKSHPKLTGRETEIARLAAEGYSNKGIGEKLYISENTVKTQLKSIFEKLGINSRSLLRQFMHNETLI